MSLRGGPDTSSDRSAERGPASLPTLTIRTYSEPMEPSHVPGSPRGLGRAARPWWRSGALWVSACGCLVVIVLVAVLALLLVSGRRHDDGPQRAVVAFTAAWNARDCAAMEDATLGSAQDRVHQNCVPGYLSQMSTWEVQIQEDSIARSRSQATIPAHLVITYPEDRFTADVVFHLIRTGDGWKIEEIEGL